MSILIPHSIVRLALIDSRGLPKGQQLTADLQITVAELFSLCCSSSFNLGCCSCLYSERLPTRCILAGNRYSDLMP